MATGRLPDPNTAPVTAKGDLYTYSTVPAKLAVGSNGETLVADSSATTGLRWQGNFAAGKNKIINGDFNIWQRGTSFTHSANVDTYDADRMLSFWSGTGTTTISRQSFTPGTAPVAGYESSFFKRIALSSGATYFSTQQRIEDVRTFAGQTATFSFWAKATSSVGFSMYFRQNFGSGGSTEVDTTTPTVTVSSSSWTRYSVTVNIPSIAGKTIGTSSSLILILVQNSGTVASNTFDTWGWQLEAGNTATAFQTATGTLAGELAACQRYYYRFVPNGVNTSWIGSGFAYATGTFLCSVRLPVTMRVNPTSIETSGTASHYRMLVGSTVATASGVPTLDTANWDNTVLAVSTSGLTVGQGGILGFNSTASGYIGFVAEL